jgi:3-oxoacyl-[acyl-carrier protein] reductase
MSPFDLEGRVALVTGAGSARGIGRAVAVTYAGAGARVALADLDGEGARRNADGLGADALGLAVDVTDPTSVASAVEQVRARLGPVDVLVCAAGITRGTALWDIRLEEFDHVMSVNVRGAFISLQAVLPDMRARGWGRVILLGSQAGKQGGGVFGSTHYACSKAALRGLCQGAARELGPFGVTCNVIAPGMVDTDIILAGGATADQVRQLAERVAAATPSRRIAQPDDIAAAALFLASDAAGQVTGEVLDVNGGAYFD